MISTENILLRDISLLKAFLNFPESLKTFTKLLTSFENDAFGFSRFMSKFSETTFSLLFYLKFFHKKLFES